MLTASTTNEKLYGDVLVLHLINDQRFLAPLWDGRTRVQADL